MRHYIIALLCMIGCAMMGQGTIDLRQLRWAADSTYVIGANGIGRPQWVLKSSIGVDSFYINGQWYFGGDTIEIATGAVDSIYRHLDTLFLRDGSGFVVIDTSNVNELDSFNINGAWYYRADTIDTRDSIYAVGYPNGTAIYLRDGEGEAFVFVAEKYLDGYTTTVGASGISPHNQKRINLTVLGKNGAFTPPDYGFVYDDSNYNELGESFIRNDSLFYMRCQECDEYLVGVIDTSNTNELDSIFLNGVWVGNGDTVNTIQVVDSIYRSLDTIFLRDGSGYVLIDTSNINELDSIFINGIWYGVGDTLNIAYDGSETTVEAGDDIAVSGSGTFSDPYIVNNTAPESTNTTDSGTIDFTQTGDNITAIVKDGSITPVKLDRVYLETEVDGDVNNERGTVSRSSDSLFYKQCPACSVGFVTKIDTSNVNEYGTLLRSNDSLFYRPCPTCSYTFATKIDTSNLSELQTLTIDSVGTSSDRRFTIGLSLANAISFLERDKQNITGGSFTTGTGNLLIGIQNGTSQTINLDGRYLQSAITSINGGTGASQTIVKATSAADFTVASASNVTTVNLPFDGSTVGLRLGYLAKLLDNSVAIGPNALQSSTGSTLVAIGKDVMRNATATGSVGIGFQVLLNLTSGVDILGIGAYAGANLTTGSYHVLMGQSAGLALTTANSNVFIGRSAGRVATGSNSVMIGANVGYSSNVSGAVYIGNEAGFNESSSNMLYIDNSAATSPLIGGNFSSNRVGINRTTASLTSTFNVGGDMIVDVLSATGTTIGAWSSTNVATKFTVGTGLGISSGALVNTVVNTDAQNLSNIKTGTSVALSISGGTGTTFSVADPDSSTTNEHNTYFDLIGTDLFIGDKGDTLSVDLSSLGGGADYDLEGYADSTGFDLTEDMTVKKSVKLVYEYEEFTIGGGSGVSDHGDLTGLGDDDHVQYLNNARGDARYYTESESDGLLATKANASHTHGLTDIDITGASEGDVPKIVSGVLSWAASGGGGVSDGDKGEVIVSGSGATWVLDTGIDAAKIGGGGVSTTEFDYLGTVTSNIQTQINGKAATSHTHAVGDLTAGSATTGQVLTYNGSAWAPATPGGGSVTTQEQSGSGTVTTSYTTIADISLAAGTWKIDANATCTTNAGMDVQFELYNVGSSTILMTSRSTASATLEYLNFGLNRLATLGSTTTIRLRAKTSNGTCTAASGENYITAIK